MTFFGGGGEKRERSAEKRVFWKIQKRNESLVGHFERTPIPRIISVDMLWRNGNIVAVRPPPGIMGQRQRVFSPLFFFRGKTFDPRTRFTPRERKLGPLGAGAPHVYASALSPPPPLRHGPFSCRQSHRVGGTRGTSNLRRRRREFPRPRVFRPLASRLPPHPHIHPVTTAVELGFPPAV